MRIKQWIFKTLDLDLPPQPAHRFSLVDYDLIVRATGAEENRDLMQMDDNRSDPKNDSYLLARGTKSLAK